MKLSNVLVISCWLLFSASSVLSSPAAHSVYQYPDILDLKGIPKQTKDSSVSIMSDQGAWHGYALFPDNQKRLGFVGPFIMTKDNGRWLAQSLANIAIYEQGKTNALDVKSANIQSHAYPGHLLQTARLDGLLIEASLFFADGRRNVIKLRIKNTSQQTRHLKAAIQGGKPFIASDVNAQHNTISLKDKDNTFYMHTGAVDNHEARLNVQKDGSFQLIPKHYQTLKPNAQVVSYFQQAVYFSDEKHKKPLTRTDVEQVISENSQRWQNYISTLLNSDSSWLKERRYQKLAVKSLITLVNNWRSPSGDLGHDSMFPSYAYPGFHGVWSWDSWKQAVATVQFDPELAKSQLWVLFDYQDSHGMVPDVIYRDKKENNWRDTKPPLAGWAVWEIYRATQDKQFLKKIYPKLIKYHQWWYNNRDHDNDTLAEYGSTDGTLIAAAWESGMDNAVRFDNSTMLKNSANAWSLAQESVDLNAYLYQEKLYLAKMASVLQKEQQAKQLNNEATKLRSRIQTAFFDTESGLYADAHIDGSGFIDDGGISTFIPLWAQVASAKQAKSMRMSLLDPNQFNTHVPLPTLSASHPKFEPDGGYWRGPVWLDQVYFVIRGLQHYGYHDDARRLTWKLFHNAEGLLEDAPIYENYNPTNGAVLESPHFSWSAAHILLLLLER